MSTTYQEEDATEGHVDAFYYPGEERLEIVTSPRTGADRLLDAIEEEKADREYQLSKYTSRELQDELTRRDK